MKSPYPAPLHKVLDEIGACSESIRWARRYGRDWDRALDETNAYRWLVWLYQRLVMERCASLEGYIQAQAGVIRELNDRAVIGPDPAKNTHLPAATIARMRAEAEEDRTKIRLLLDALVKGGVAPGPLASGTTRGYWLSSAISDLFRDRRSGVIVNADMTCSALRSAAGSPPRERARPFHALTSQVFRATAGAELLDGLVRFHKENPT